MIPKILEVFISQIGVEEDAAHTNHGEAVKYQIAAGLPKGGGFPWCQSLFFWSGMQAYGDKNPVPKTGGVIDCLRKAIKENIEFLHKENATSDNIPVGSQFILDLGKGEGHTGIVEFVDKDGTLHTIEGNSNHEGGRDGYEVCRQTKRHITDKVLVGFICYNYPDSNV